MFTVPAPARIGHAPATLHAADVQFPSQSGSVIRGWFLQGYPGDGAVLLLHGVRANRLAMLDRASFLNNAGYTVLMLDFQAHGESPGKFITFGSLESRDAAAALQFLRDHAPGERIGVIGVSMGGAAALVGTQPLAVDALVLESVYPTIHQAAANRLHTWLGPLGGLAPLLTPMVINQVSATTNVSEQELRPIDRIGEVHMPVLVVAGDADPYTPPAETRALFDRAHPPKALWILGGAGHEDLYAYARQAYEHHIGAFFARYLRPNSLVAKTAGRPGGLH